MSHLRLAFKRLKKRSNEAVSELRLHNSLQSDSSSMVIICGRTMQSH